MYMNPINTMRVSGLASGIDTDSLVSQLMAVERIPLDRLKQNRQLIEWTQEAYRDINSTLLAFRNQVFNMSLQGTFLVNKVISSDETVATATAGSSAIGSVYNILVTQLASSATAISSSTISIQKNVATGASLAFPLDLTGRSFTLTVGSNSPYIVTLDGYYSDINTLVNDINDKINKLGVTGVTVYAASNNKLQFVSDNAFTLASSDDTLAKLGFAVASGGSIASSVQGVDVNEPLNLMVQEGRLKNGFTTDTNRKLTFSITTYDQSGNAIVKDFTIDPATQSLQNVISAINSAGLGLSGFYDSASDKVAFTSNLSGDNNPSGADIAFSGSSLDFFTKTLSLQVTDGINALFDINGLSTSSKSNTFTINGVTFTLKKSGAAATISVQQDIDAVVAKIKDFITQYNDTLDKLYTKLTEKRYRDYPPLTDDQKSAMKDTDIQQWEEKAKSGLLNGDSVLYDAFYKLRNAVSDTISGMDAAFDQAYDIGITSGQWYENGHLYLDENKLRDALAKDPNAVMQFFTKTVSITIYDTDSEATKQQKRQEIYDKSGIAQRLYNILGDVISSITDKAGQAGGFSLVDNSVLGKQLKEMDLRIDDMEQRLTDIENRYYSEFTAMEQALNQMNTQSAWLSQQLGALQG